MKRWLNYLGAKSSSLGVMDNQEKKLRITVYKDVISIEKISLSSP